MDSYTRLRELLSVYVGTCRQPDTTELQQGLHAVTPEQRYELVAAASGWLGTAIHIAAILDHIETISCILDSFTAEVRYKLLKIQSEGCTVIHIAALDGHTEAMRCMLDKVLPENQIQLLNTRDTYNKTPLDRALSFNKPETAALIRQYIETAKKNIKEKQEEKQDLNNADSQRRLKRKIVDLNEEVPRLRAKLEEQEVLNQQKDQQIAGLEQKIIEMEAMIKEMKGQILQVKMQTQKQEEGAQKAAEELPVLAATTEVHGVQLQRHDVKITTLQQQGDEMKTEMVELKGEISQVKQQTQEQQVNVQDAAAKIPVLTASTEGHGTQLKQHDEKISGLQLQGVEQKHQIKASTEGISKNRDEILQQDCLFQKKPDKTTELPEDCCINPEQEVERQPTPAGEEVEEEDIDRGIQVIDN